MTNSNSSATGNPYASPPMPDSGCREANPSSSNDTWPIRADGTYSPDEVRHGQRLAAWPHLSAILTGAGIGVLAVCGWLLVRALHDPARLVDAATALVSIATGIVFMVAVSRFGAQGTAAALGHQISLIGRDGIEVRSGSSDTRLCWTAFSRFRCSDRMAVLLFQKNSPGFLMLSRAHFEDDSQWNRFLELVHSKLVYDGPRRDCFGNSSRQLTIRCLIIVGILSCAVAVPFLLGAISRNGAQVAEVAGPNPALRAAVQTALIHLSSILLPLLLFFGCPLAWIVLKSWRLKRTVHQYREPQFRPINFLHLDKNYRNALDRWTREFQGLDFDVLGDFQNKFDPVAVYNRYFTGCAGAVVGDVTATGGHGGSCLLSILEDSTYVETAAVTPFEFKGKLCDEDHFVCTMCGECGLGELLETHLQIVEREATRRATRVLAFAPEQFREVAIYAERRFKRWRQRCGERTGEVPDPVLPKGEPLDPCDVFLEFGSRTPVGKLAAGSV